MAKLTLVGLPIGNAQDITKRAYAILENQKSFLVEDTRNFKSLLGHYGLDLSQYKLVSFHDHNKENITKLIEKMDKGEDLYLCSDAGSPVLSDPAYPLVRAALDNGHEIETIPGVSSPVAALELSGLPPHPFKFWGFLARKDQAKISWFDELESGVTHICFESPVRMQATLELFFKNNNSRNIKIAVARELTKLYQEVISFDLENLKKEIEKITFRGEMVLLIYIETDTKKDSTKNNSKIKELANSYIEKQSPRNLSKLISSILGGKPSEYYDQLTSKK